MKRAILYARVSSQQQVDKDLSIPSQFEQMRRYCQEQEWEIIDEIADEAKSGRYSAREGLQRIMKSASQQPCPFDILLVWKLSRFARNLRDAVNLEFTLKQNGIALISISEPTDNTPLGQSFRDIMHVVNQMFSLQLGEDTRRAQAENAQRGYWNGGNYPLGYRPRIMMDDKGNNKTKLEIEPEYSPVVERIFQMYRSGMGFKSIAIELNKEGLKTNYDKPYSIYAISKILRDEIYTGTYQWGKPPKVIRIENAYPAIIDKRIFSQVQQLLAQRAVMHPRTINSRYLLSGLVYCGKCGWKMIGSTTSYKQKRYRYYYCGFYKRTGLCTQAPIEAEKLERLVLQKIKKQYPIEIQKILETYNAESNKQTTDTSKKLQQKTQQLQDIESRLSNIYEALETRKLPVDIISSRLTELSRQKTDLEIEIFQLQNQPWERSEYQPLSISDIEKHLHVLEKLFNIGTPAEQRVFYQACVRRIVVDDEIRVEYVPGGEFLSMV